MQAHRLQFVESDEIKIIDFSQEAGFSSFDFLRKEFAPYTSPVHRCFSLARSFCARTLILERIKSVGLLESEREDIVRLGGVSGDAIYRLSFWRDKVTTVDDIGQLTSCSLIGYAIIKADAPSLNETPTWYVFESVFIKFQHENNCIPFDSSYDVVVARFQFSIEGVLYCQQNSCNKACAQVALRSILSRVLPEKDIPYRKINELAGVAKSDLPGKGLTLQQITNVLFHFGLEVEGFQYTNKMTREERAAKPYQEYLYSGVESGIGGLLVFNFGNEYHPDRRAHVVPVFGHTFNKDTWVTDADVGYFKINEKYRYMPSANWTSSYICHDDNFGPNFCIPQHYVETSQLIASIGIRRVGVPLHAKEAELAALHVLGNALVRMDRNNKWKRELLSFDNDTRKWGVSNQIVLRVVFRSRDKYLKELAKAIDWKGFSEADGMMSLLGRLRLPTQLLVVEYSLLQLYPANKRKLGEVVFDGSQHIRSLADVERALAFVRMPGCYAFPTGEEGGGLISVTSCIKDHIPLS